MTKSYSTTFTEKIEFEKNDKIMTYYARDFSGRQFFCYIRCDIDGYRKMQNDFLNEGFSYPERA